MTRKLMILFAAFAAAFGAWADTETVGGYTWTYRINGDTAEIYNDGFAAISPSPTGSVTIPSTLGGKPVTNIGDNVFNGCRGLTSVTIPKGAVRIGDQAFLACTGLTNVTMPDSVTSIGDSAFAGCSGLTSVTIPDGVKSIGESAFVTCSGLTSVTIPDSVTSIGNYTFYGCNGLRDVTVSQYVLDRQLQNVFLYVHSSITNVSYSSTVTRIGPSAFFGCSGLTSVTIPDSVTNIGSAAFACCSGLTAVHVADLAAWCRISFADNPLSYAHNLYLNGEKVEDLTIPDDITSICPSAFSGCSGLRSVTIPNSVTSIGASAFYGCSGLTAVHVTDLAAWCRISFGSSDANPLSYAHNLYLNGEKVSDLTIPDGVTGIKTYAFAGCSGLKSVTMPSSVTSISSSAFSGCTGIRNVVMPNRVKSIGSSAFSGCSGLREVTIPNSVTSIGSSAFYGCSGLASVTIPDSVKSIGNYAFQNCSGLTSVTIPKSVTSLPTEVFDGCDRLWTAWYRTLANSSAADVAGGSPSVSTTIVQQVEAPYALTDHAADRAIASVTVDGDCEIDSFVLKDGEVYDSVLYVSNIADRAVTLTLPTGYAYKTYKGTKPLVIPAKSQCMLSITRVADRTFLVSREELEDVQ